MMGRTAKNIKDMNKKFFFLTNGEWCTLSSSRKQRKKIRSLPEQGGYGGVRHIKNNALGKIQTAMKKIIRYLKCTNAALPLISKK